MSKKTLLSWSSGKDSAWALHVLKGDPRYDVAGLFTVVNSKYGRVAMHGVRAELLRLQAQAAGLPLREIAIPDPCSDEAYAAVMREFVDECASSGVRCMAFGDLYLEDVRAYREKQLGPTGIEAIFPLWQRPTGPLVREMLAAGLKAYVTCVDTRKLPRALVGRELTVEFLGQLPEGVDPCAERGEFHTVALAGPMFDRAIEARIGETVVRDGFAFADVVPAVCGEAVAGNARRQPGSSSCSTGASCQAGA